MLNRFKLLNTSIMRTNLVVKAVSTQIPSSLAIRFSYVYTPLYGCVQKSCRMDIEDRVNYSFIGRS